MTELALPIVVPLLTAALSIVFFQRARIQIALNIAGAFGLALSAAFVFITVEEAGFMTLHVGSWPAPYGITLIADPLAAVMVTVTGVVAVAVVLYATGSIDHKRIRHGFFPLVQVLLTGVCGAFLTGDLFNLYVCFEVMLMASFSLLCLGRSRAQLEGGIKYVTLNLLSSALFLIGLGILYGVVGTLNMADVAQKMDAVEPALGTLVAALFLVAFGIKAGVFPLFFWLPASYHTPPPVVSALFAGLLTKVGVYALIRIFTLIFVRDVGFTRPLLMTIAGLTMLTGVFGAMAQKSFRRILSFHIVSQIGYMLMGLALLTPLGLAGSVFYLVHHIIVKTNLFFVSGISKRLHDTDSLDKLGGLYARRPALAALFAVPALSLAGVPPLSGFFAKLSLLKAGFEDESYTIVAVALVVSLFTLLSMTKIWNEVFWKPPPRPPAGPTSGLGRMVVPVMGLATLTVALGIFSEPAFRFAQTAADSLLDRRAYIEAVLGGRP